MKDGFLETMLYQLIAETNAYRLENDLYYSETQHLRIKVIRKDNRNISIIDIKQIDVKPV